jgi:muconolactone D-isomerase
MSQEFLVEIDIDLPPEMGDEAKSDLRDRESAYGRDLVGSGVIQRIWRVPGRLANVGIWAARDATQPHELICGLPMYRWAQVTVRPLAVHPLEADRNNGH